MAYRISCMRGEETLKQVTKDTKDEASRLFRDWYKYTLSQVQKRMGGQGFVQPKPEGEFEYTITPVYYTTCKLPESQRTEKRRYTIKMAKV